ncbi:hypothetical protein KBB25_03940 [Candidatus Gracilibacteria bacterium]|nr:hypothetical protein [Candidatus Gracilibacteria bacterium]
MKFGFQLTFGILGISLLGGGIFYGINQYEKKNDCTFSLLSLSCEYVYHLFDDNEHMQLKKPLILLYPEKNMDVRVHLSYAPGFFATFPEYSVKQNGWEVTAYPDGNLMDKASGQETYGLFWEGNPGSDHFDMSHGSVIKGSEIRDFLYRKLTEIGLNTKEKSDFIMFWYPKLQNYPYVHVTFAGNEYTETAKLEISPKPDSLLRVFMVAKPLSEYKKIPEQTFEPFQRKGFSAVEWGGTIVQ